MSVTVVTTGTVAPVVGDGTSTRSRATSRWRRWRLPIGIVGLLCVVGLLAALPEPVTTTQPLAPDNPHPTGARAAAQILGDQGVDVRYTRRIADVQDLAVPGSTVLLVGDTLINDEQLAVLKDSGADLVLVDAEWVLGQLTDTLGATGDGSGTTPETRAAQCDDPDAAAAETITATGSLHAFGSGAVLCFPAAGTTTTEGGAYGVVQQGDRRIVALSDEAPLTNARLADEGNAALVLRMLGHHERLVWYIPSIDDLGAGGDGGSGGSPPIGDIVPPITGLLALQLLVVAALGALWRGRRLGRVVSEQLPVVVRAGETTRGRGRLYRRSRSYGHASAALRAGTTARSAARLGLPRSAPAPVVIDAIARASARDPRQIEALLYGPPPTDDDGLAQLARDLDHLESEVHRS